MKDENGNINCRNAVNCNNSTGCNNSTWCNNSTRCNNSTWCDNSTGCNNSTYLLFCHGLVLEKFRIFNKKVKNKEEFIKKRNAIFEGIGRWTHPKQLTEENIAWLKKNVKQFDKKVLDKVINDSKLPHNPIVKP